MTTVWVVDYTKYAKREESVMNCVNYILKIPNLIKKKEEKPQTIPQ